VCSPPLRSSRRSSSRLPSCVLLLRPLQSSGRTAKSECLYYSLLYPPPSKRDTNVNVNWSFHLRALSKFPYETNVVFWHGKENFHSCGTCKVSCSITHLSGRTVIMLMSRWCLNRCSLPSPVYPTPNMTLRESAMILSSTLTFSRLDSCIENLLIPLLTIQGSGRRRNRLTERV